MHSIEEIIHDLNVLEEYFANETGGAVPSCIHDAVEILEKIKEEQK